jgi:hypothetical protein
MNKDVITPDRLKQLGFKEWNCNRRGTTLSIRNLHYIPKWDLWYYKNESIEKKPTTIKEVEALYSGLYGEKLINQ